MPLLIGHFSCLFCGDSIPLVENLIGIQFANSIFIDADQKQKKPPKQGGKRVDKRRDNSGLQQNTVRERVGLASGLAGPALHFIRPAYFAASGMIGYQASILRSVRLG
ncbi:hypothetical protein ACXRSX_08335 [Aeromonas dhakensis]|uniref:hypothetical protein n=1 Tax=Aeromonas dhakensis TaxID=196024 RepID=UPI002D796D82|nr:hypothetical protein [Aeromonas dhakensis]WRT72053.1 hypothetical protein VK677_17180 [Aeromonas dhakensis]